MPCTAVAFNEGRKEVRQLAVARANGLNALSPSFRLSHFQAFLGRITFLPPPPSPSPRARLLTSPTSPSVAFYSNKDELSAKRERERAFLPHVLSYRLEEGREGGRERVYVSSCLTAAATALPRATATASERLVLHSVRSIFGGKGSGRSKWRRRRGKQQRGRRRGEPATEGRGRGRWRQRRQLSRNAV